MLILYVTQIIERSQPCKRLSQCYETWVID